MRTALLSATFGLLFVGVLALPQVAFAEEPGRLITVRSDDDQLGVKQVVLDMSHRSSDQDLIDDGTIDTIEVEYDVDTVFNNPTNVTFNIAELRAAGKVNERVFSPTVTGLFGVKGYYFRARLINTSAEVGEWKDTTRILTLPPRPKNLRVPGKKKTTSSINLKWDHPRRCQAEGCDYYVKVFNNRKKNKDLVVQKQVNNANYITLTSSSGLAIGKKYRFKVQSCLSSNTCNGNFSQQKEFRR